MTWNGLLGLRSSRSQPWGQPHAPQAEWRRALAPLGSPSGCCSFCPPCCSPGAVLVGTAAQRDDPCWRDSESGTRPRRVLGPGSERALAGPWGSLTA